MNVFNEILTVENHSTNHMRESFFLECNSFSIIRFMEILNFN